MVNLVLFDTFCGLCLLVVWMLSVLFDLMVYLVDSYFVYCVCYGVGNSIATLVFIIFLVVTISLDVWICYGLCYWHLF